MDAVCEVCGVIGVERLLLCCSVCKGGHKHQYCLDNVHFHALEDWFCDECSQRHNKGSHSRSLEKVSNEKPSNHTRFDSTSRNPITKRLESATVVGTRGQQKRKSMVVGANLKKKHSSMAKYLQKMRIRKKSNMRGKGSNRRVIRSKRSSDCTEQLNLSTGQVGSAPSLKGVQQPTLVIVNALTYTLGDTGQSHVLKPLEGLAHKSMQTPQSLTTDQVYSTSSIEVSSKAKFALEGSATEDEISNTVQNLRKDSPKKRRRLILTEDDEDEEEQKAGDVQQENVNHQRGDELEQKAGDEEQKAGDLKCNEPIVEHRINTEYHVEVVQTGDVIDQTHINGRPMKRRRRYIDENEDEEDTEGAESALNNASKWSSNDSANMVSETPVAIATDHSLRSRPSDSECADHQYHFCLQPLDEPVWSGVFKIDNKVCLKLDAHLSNKACQRVHELLGFLQPVVEVRTLSRLQAWPERWISSGPTDESIGQNEDLTRLDRIIKSDDALQVTVGIAELLIFPSVLLPEQYHLFQGKHYLWGVLRQRKDILDNGVHVEEQDDSAHATGEGQQQEHNLLDQQDEALYELSDKETFAAKHIVDADDQLQADGDPEVQNDTMKVATSEVITSLSSRYCLKKVDKISLPISQLQEEKKVLAPLRERMASADAEHKCIKIQRETLKTQAKDIPELRSEIGSLEQEKIDLQVENSTEKTQCQALQGLIDLNKFRTALSNEKAGPEAELKSTRLELEKCQIEVKSLRERIQTLEEEVDWLGSEERHKAAITASEGEGDKSAHDSEIKTFHADLEKTKSQVESYKSKLKATKREKKEALQKLKNSKCHLIDTLSYCSSYVLAHVQSANPDFDASSIDWSFRRPDPDTEALIERNMGIVLRFVHEFVTDVGVGQRSLSRKRPRKLNTRVAGPEWRKK